MSIHDTAWCGGLLQLQGRTCVSCACRRGGRWPASTLSAVRYESSPCSRLDMTENEGRGRLIGAIREPVGPPWALQHPLDQPVTLSPRSIYLPHLFLDAPPIHSIPSLASPYIDLQAPVSLFPTSSHSQQDRIRLRLGRLKHPIADQTKQKGHNGLFGITRWLPACPPCPGRSSFWIVHTQENRNSMLPHWTAAENASLR